MENLEVIKINIPPPLSPYLSLISLSLSSLHLSISIPIYLDISLTLYLPISPFVSSFSPNLSPLSLSLSILISISPSLLPLSPLSFLYLPISLDISLTLNLPISPLCLLYLFLSVSSLSLGSLHLSFLYIISLPSIFPSPLSMKEMETRKLGLPFSGLGFRAYGNYLGFMV